MGLDCVVGPRAKPGCEVEWKVLVERWLFQDDQMTDTDMERLVAIGIEGYESLGAPRVGYDERANAWPLLAHPRDTESERAALIAEHKGYYAVRALENCDGVPTYSNGGFYEGVGETSLRGQFFNGCEYYIPEEMAVVAWSNMWPEQAVTYGEQLLALVERKDELIRAAEQRVEAQRRQPEPGFLARLTGRKRLPVPEAPDFDVFDFLEVAGKWYRFWGARGHPIQAYF